MFLAFKELSYSKLRYSLISLIIIAILFLVFFVTGLANGLAFGDSSSIRNLEADYILLNEDATGAIVKSELTLDQVNALRGQLEQKSSPLTMTTSAIVRENKKDIDVVYFSVDTANYHDVDLVKGKNISDLKANEVIADESIKLYGDYKLNDTIIEKMTGNELTIVGFMKDRTYSNMPTIYADFSSNLNTYYGNKPFYNAVMYSGSKTPVKGFDTFTKKELVKSIPGYTETQGSLRMIVVFLFIISAFVSTVFFYVITIQKLNQFGILKAIGAKTSSIANSIMIQVFLLTIIGLLFSLLLILGMSQVIPEGMPFRLSPMLMVSTAVLFLVVNLLGALLSVYKAAKVDALEAIGRVE
ncbi:ABC transporter permease [Niallia alba]|uniref:ABC transporter permease n=1 Tax=Niallia alba TaxID=2729105 RepID=UPI002E1D6A45|nr:ABC transporter permease [Niallia alba]